MRHEGVCFSDELIRRAFSSRDEYLSLRVVDDGDAAGCTAVERSPAPFGQA